MAKNVFVGIIGGTKKVRTIYVGANGGTKKVLRGYVGTNDGAKLFYSGSEPVLIFESNAVGTTTLILNPGTYEITLIGGGSGLSGYWRYPYGIKQSHPSYISGFCGGTIQARVKISAATSVSVVVGGAGANKVVARASNVPVQGNKGSDTYITGIPNATLIGGGGVSANITWATDDVATRYDSGTMGHPGINTASGSAVSAIILDNPNTETSYTWRVLGAPYSNTNWPENTALGRGGSYSPRGTGLSDGSPGFVRIKML
jgi:hypothetical protein